MKKILLKGLVASAFSVSSMSYAMTHLDDDSLANVTGQALFSLVKEKDSTQGLDFFKLAMQAELSLNTNIKSLQLGCGGANGAGACDIDISELSFGCVTNPMGACITLPTTLPGQPTGLDSNNTIANQSALKDFVLTNPFFQFAIKGGDQAATREVVGIRVGAEKAEGPMSIGDMKSFSGYLSGLTNLNISAQQNIAVTCQRGTANCADIDASKFSTSFGSGYTQDSAFLGVKDGEVLNFLGTKVRYRDLTIDTKAASSNANASLNGTRLTQVGIANLGLGTTVDNVVAGLKVNQSCGDSIFGGCNILTGAGISNALLPLLVGGIQTYMKQQTLAGLGLAVPVQGSLSDAAYNTLLTNNLNAYVLPYNLNNVHQLDVNSNLFGIALTSLAGGIKYPGYEKAVGQGWSMYLQDAFTLNVNDSLTSLMSNMVQNGNAKAGNITTLAPAYRNCFGSLKFC